MNPAVRGTGFKGIATRYRDEMSLLIVIILYYCLPCELVAILTRSAQFTSGAVG
jgi:hypothetical protein